MRASSCPQPATGSVIPGARSGAGRGARRAGGCNTQVELGRREPVGLVDELAAAREVEQLARVGRAGQHDHLDARRHVAHLELEPLAARVHEARHHDVERRALFAIGRARRHVEHEHPVDRPRERVPQRDAVDDAAVHQAPAVVLDDREHARERRAREQRRLQRTAAKHDFVAGVEIGRDDAERYREVGEAAGRRGPVDQRVQAGRFEQVGLPAHHVPRPAQAGAGEHVRRGQRRPHAVELRDAGEVRRVGDGRAVERTGRRPDHDVGFDAPLEHGAEHPDLGHTLVAPARQDERGARRAAVAIAALLGERPPGAQPADVGAAATRPFRPFVVHDPMVALASRDPGPLDAAIRADPDCAGEKTTRVYSASFPTRAGSGAARDRVL